MLKPQAGNFEKESVYKLGSHIAKQLGYTPNGDIDSAIKKAGGIIEYRNPMDLDAGDSGSVCIKSIGNFRIFLSTHTSSNRDRFTVAHELGHYVLHYFLKYQSNNQLSEPMICNRAGEGPVEWEANWFAAGFLMPETDFRETFKEKNGNYKLLAEYFGVSQSAIEIRARVLGLS